ncbi:MAG: ABC transporter permease [Thermoguttaceae bacterium]
MSLWKIAWRSIQHRSLASGLTAFSMSLGVALIVIVIVIYGVLDKSFRRSAQGVDIIVGPKGSSLELVISTVFYQRDPIGKIPYDYLVELRSGRYRSLVEAAIPMALGEHYRGYPVVATSSEFLTRLEYVGDSGLAFWLDSTHGKKYSFYDGKNITDSNDFDAVIGYTVARKLGLKVNDKIKTSHGRENPEEHVSEFTIVGILNPSGTPNDAAIFINIEGFYQMHAGNENVLEDSIKLKKDSTSAKNDAAVAENSVAESEANHAADDEHGDEQAHETEVAAAGEDSANTEKEGEKEHVHTAECDHGNGKRELSAILVITKEERAKATVTTDLLGRPDTVQTGGSLYEKVFNADILALPNRIEEDLNAQAAKPAEVISFLFEKIIGNIQIVLLILAALVVMVAGIGMMVSIYNSMNERRHEIAIMRALGARRITVMSIILLESILLSLGGGALGVLIGHMLIFVIGPWISSATGILVSAFHFQASEVILIPGLILLASVVGYLPAVIAYRTDVAQSLQQ